MPLEKHANIFVNRLHLLKILHLLKNQKIGMYKNFHNFYDLFLYFSLKSD